MLVCDSVIVAQCTPKGAGAIAIVRLSGQGVFDIVARMSQLSGKKTILNLSSQSISYGFVLDHRSKKIDEVLFLVMRRPRTFTGEDTIEINCHNNQLIVEEIIATAIHFGARHAMPGEFTKRAVLNGKIDIVQAEAIHELIVASSSEQLRIALAQKEGSLSAYIATIEQMIYEILCFAQASFEFIEEENPEFYEHILQKISAVQDKILHIRSYFNQQQRIKEGMRIAIIGSVNAGKSSLFNALLKKNRALVSDTPGTTRDSIESNLFRDGIQFTLIDTAGIRKTNDKIEESGIKRSLEEAALADVILLVIGVDSLHDAQEQAAYQELYQQYKEKTLIVISKNDLTATQPIQLNFADTVLPVSIFQEKSIDLLEKIILNRSKKLHGETTPFLISTRQFHLLLSIEELLKNMKKNLEQAKSYELIAADAVQALQIIAQVTGKTIQERGMDAIFERFCVGK